MPFSFWVARRRNIFVSGPAFLFFDGVITGYIYIYRGIKWVVNDGIFSWDMVEARNMVIFVWGYHRISRAIMGYSWD